MNFVRILASVSKYAGIVLWVAGIGVSGVTLTLPSAAEAAQESKPVVKKAASKYAKKAGKPAPNSVAKASTKKSRLAAIKSEKQQVVEQAPLRATQTVRIAMPGFIAAQVANTLPGTIHRYPDLRMDSLNSAPQMAAPYPDEAHAPRKAAAACLLNGELFLLADCNTAPGDVLGPDARSGIGREATDVLDHLPLPGAPDAELPAASKSGSPPEPS